MTEALEDLFQAARAERRQLLAGERPLSAQVQRAQRARLGHPSPLSSAWVRQLATPAAVSFSVAATVVAASWLWHRAGPLRSTAAARAAAPTPALPSAAPELPPAATAASTPRSSPALPASRSERLRARPAAAPARPPPVLAEPAAAAAVLRRLEGERDPAGALRSVADYRRDFPAGALRSAVDVAEIHAYLALARDQEALQRLDRLDGEGRVGAELRATQAELLERRGDLAGAARAWGQVLGAGPSAPLLRRAVCRRGLDRPHGEAAPELQRCLELDPTGPQAARAQAALDESAE